MRSLAYWPFGGKASNDPQWTVPEDIKDHAGTDKPSMVHYPHFSTTELHTDFVDW
jgi:hypothetical protein